MSVITTADEKIDEVKENLSLATQALSEIVAEKVWGFEDFSDSYQEELIDTLSILLKLRRVFK